MALLNTTTWDLSDISPDDLEYYEPSLKVTGVHPDKMLFCGILEPEGIKVITGSFQDKEEQINRIGEVARRISARAHLMGKTINRFNRCSDYLWRNLSKISDAELQCIVRKQENRLGEIGINYAGYREEIMKARQNVFDEAAVQELFASGLTAYEIMERGGPVTDLVLMRWLEGQESEADI